MTVHARRGGVTGPARDGELREERTHPDCVRTRQHLPCACAVEGRGSADEVASARRCEGRDGGRGGAGEDVADGVLRSAHGALECET